MQETTTRHELSYDAWRDALSAQLQRLFGEPLPAHLNCEPTYLSGQSVEQAMEEICRLYCLVHEVHTLVDTITRPTLPESTP